VSSLWNFRDDLNRIAGPSRFTPPGLSGPTPAPTTPSPPSITSAPTSSLRERRKKLYLDTMNDVRQGRLSESRAGQKLRQAGFPDSDNPFVHTETGFSKAVTTQLHSYAHNVAHSLDRDKGGLTSEDRGTKANYDAGRTDTLPPGWVDLGNAPKNALLPAPPTPGIRNAYPAPKKLGGVVSFGVGPTAAISDAAPGIAQRALGTLTGGGLIGQTVTGIGQAATYNPAGVEQAALHPIRTAEAVGSSIKDLAMHPQDHPGQALLMYWAAASGLGSAASRLAGATSAVRAGEGLGAAVKRSGAEGGSLLHTPAPGTYKRNVYGGEPTAVKGPFDIATSKRDAAEAELSILTSQAPHITLPVEKAKIRARLRSAEVKLKATQAEVDRLAPIHARATIGAATEGPVTGLTVDRLLSYNPVARQVQRVRNRVLQRSLDDYKAQRFRASPLSAQSTIGRETRAIRRVDAAFAQATAQAQARKASGVWKGLNRNEHAAMAVAAIYGKKAFDNPDAVIAKMQARHQDWINQGFDPEANLQQITDLELARGVLHKPSDRFKEALDLTRKVSKDTEQALIAAGHLRPEDAQSRTLKLLQMYEGADWEAPTLAKMGIPTPAEVKAAQEAARLEARAGKAHERAVAAGEAEIARARAGGRSRAGPEDVMIGTRIVGQAPERLSTEQSARAASEVELNKLEAQQTKRLNQLVETKYGKYSKEDRKEDLRRNAENAKAARQESGYTRGVTKEEKAQRVAEAQAKRVEVEQKVKAEREKAGGKPSANPAKIAEIQSKLDQVKAIDEGTFTPSMIHSNKDDLYMSLVSSAGREIKWAKFASKRDAVLDFWTRALERERAKVGGSAALTKLEAQLDRAKAAEKKAHDLLIKRRSGYSGVKAQKLPTVLQERRNAIEADIQDFIAKNPTHEYAIAWKRLDDRIDYLRQNLYPDLFETPRGIVQGPGHVLPARGAVKAEKLGTLASAAKENYDRIRERNQAQQRPVGMVGAPADTQIDPDAFYFPLSSRYTQAAPRGGRSGAGVARVSPGPYGYAPANKGTIGGLGQEFTGGTIRKGWKPADVAATINDRGIRVNRLLQVEQFYDDLWKLSSATKRSEFDIPIRSSREVRQELKRFFTKMADQLHASPDETLSLSKEELDALASMLRYNEKGRIGDYVEGVRWVDSRLVKDAGDVQPRGAGAKAVDLITNPIRSLDLYMRPAYVLNLLGNMGMAGITQGWRIVPSVKAAALASVKEPENAQIIDSLMGSSLARSYSTNTGKGWLARSNRRLAEAWNDVTDLHMRRSAWMHEAARAGYKTPEARTRLLNDPKLRSKMVEVTRRANKNMVDFGSLTPFEKQYLRRAIYFYPWVTRSTIWALRSIVENPGKVFTLSQLAQIGAANAHKRLGTPEARWADQAGLIPVGAPQGDLQKVLNPQSLNTYGSAASTIRSAIEIGKGIVGLPSDPQQGLAGLLPPAGMLGAQLTGGGPDVAGPKGLPGLLWGTPQGSMLRRFGLFGGPSKTYPETGTGPALGPLSAGGLYPRGISLSELHKQGVKQLDPADRAATRSIDDANEMIRTLAGAGVQLPPEANQVFELQAMRERALAALPSDARQIERLRADLMLVIQLGQMDQQTAQEILNRAAGASDNDISTARQKLNDRFFGGREYSQIRAAVAKLQDQQTDQAASASPAASP
jgi:hypothetical protein